MTLLIAPRREWFVTIPPASCKFAMEGRNRKLNRWQGFDYSQSGLYFVTICTHQRIEWFGRVKNGRLVLNEYGEIAHDCWMDLPNHYPNCILDEFVLMPNHAHGIVGINNAPGRERFVTVPPVMKQSPGGDRNGHGLSEIMRGFKTFSSKQINALQNTSAFHWQKSFHDRVIRNDDELNRIRVYIANNPINWETDRNNMKPDPGVAI